MVLRGRLSNPEFRELLDCLTSYQPRKARRRTKKRAGSPDGRRAFGTVSGAIIKVLTENESEMSVRAIRREVELLLGGSVSRFSVSDYLLTRSKGPKPLFQRTSWGHYRLLG